MVTELGVICRGESGRPKQGSAVGRDVAGILGILVGQRLCTCLERGVVPRAVPGLCRCLLL